MQRSIIEISGNDTRKFLQGIITNDINLLSRQRALYSLMLNPSGRYLYDFFIVEKDKLDGSVLIDIHRKYADEFIEKILMFKLRSDVVVMDVTNDIDMEMEYNDPRNLSMGKRFIIKGGVHYDDDYEFKRISHRVVDGYADLISGRSIPLESRMDEQNAISFNKGCYVGQELTSRTKHTGIVRKNIYKVNFCETIKLRKGDEILSSDGKKVGEMCSSIRGIGLAKLRIEDVRDNKRLYVSYGELEVEGD